jgi:hypothetical protein
MEYNFTIVSKASKIKPVKQFKKGFQEVVVGIIGGVLFSIVLNTFKESNLLPSDVVIWFTVFGVVSAVVTMFSFKTAGVIFTLGWILGAWLLKGVLEPFDFMVYFWAPVLTLVARALLTIKKVISIN